jgi:hypothetical protein
MSSRFPMRATWAALSFFVPAALLAAQDDSIDPLQTQTCNEPPPLAGAGVDGFAAQVNGMPLKAGTTVDTFGTSPWQSDELTGPVIFQRTRGYQFTSAGQTVKGEYGELIVNGSDGCKSHIQIRPAWGCISKVEILRFRHRGKLVADFRTDQGGDIPSTKASRSAAPGRTITFELPAKVCPGQTSKWLLLNTSMPTLAPTHAIVFHADTGGSSSARPFHVPVP